MRERNGMDLIACRSCGRAEVDVIVVARDAEAAVAGDPANPGGDHG
jgi:(E)-4-hydroxy-3-methylbut-2-enyl-diphosphate synthase